MVSSISVLGCHYYFSGKVLHRCGPEVCVVCGMLNSIRWVLKFTGNHAPSSFSKATPVVTTAIVNN